MNLVLGLGTRMGIATPFARIVAAPSGEPLRQEVLTREKTSPAAAPRSESSPGLRLPEQSATELAIAVGLFFATLLLLWPQRDFVSMNADEGIVLQGAARILRGEVPYRDFFSFYTPASYYLLALAFKIFGESLLVGRTLLLVYGGLFSALTYLLARRIASRRAALFAAFLVLAVWPFRFYVLHNWDSTVWALLAFYCAVRWLDSPNLAWSFGIGFLASLAFLSEQSKGFGLVMGVLAALFVIARRQGQAGIRRRHWTAIAAGFALPLAIVFLYFAAQHALGALFAAWLWPLRHYSAANKTAYGFSVPLADAREMLRSTGGHGLAVGIMALFIAALVAIPALPLIALLSALSALRQAGGGSGPWGFKHWLLAACTTAGLLLSVFATGRPDMSHMIYLAPICFFLIPSLPARMATGPARKRMTVMGAGLFVLVTVFALAVQWNGLVARQVAHTRRGTIRMRATDEALGYIQAHVPEGHKLLVHPYSPLYSFLSGTFSPTRFEYLQAGMHTPQQFQQAARELSSDPTAAVLLELNFPATKLPSIWPATPAEAVAGDAVAKYVLSHYRACAVLNAGVTDSTFVYMTRSDRACPR